MNYKTIFNHWHWTRWVRLLMGVLITIQGIYIGQSMMIFLGILFTIMPVLNIGCCATGNCTTTTVNHSNNKKTDDIIFEEIK